MAEIRDGQKFTYLVLYVNNTRTEYPVRPTTMHAMWFSVRRRGVSTLSARVALSDRAKWAFRRKPILAKTLKANDYRTSKTVYHYEPGTSTYQYIPSVALNDPVAYNRSTRSVYGLTHGPICSSQAPKWRTDRLHSLVKAHTRSIASQTV